MIGLHSVNFDPVTPEISLLICVPVYLKWAKVVRRAGVPKLIGGGGSNDDERINNGDGASTSDRNLVSFHPITPEFTVLNCVQ